MINTVDKYLRVHKKEVFSITCDKCGKEIMSDDVVEMQEAYHVRLTGGYGSIFGDESKVAADFCQQCLKELIGPYCRVNEGGEE